MRKKEDYHAGRKQEAKKQKLDWRKLERQKQNDGSIKVVVPSKV